ncbi:MAG: acyl-ACP--UDP-N-acetylglucosamine O-acyltransferase, partial [Janthinobacterium lividum]
SVRRENRAFGLNKIGLERRGFTPAEVKQLREAYRLLQISHLNTTQALEAIRAKVASGEFGERVAYLAEFIAKSERGVIK